MNSNIVSFTLTESRRTNTSWPGGRDTPTSISRVDLNCAPESPIVDSDFEIRAIIDTELGSLDE